MEQVRPNELADDDFAAEEFYRQRLEKPQTIAQQLEKIAKAGAADWPKCWITPSAGLEFLPYKNAIAKMNRLGAAVREFEGVPVAQTV